LGEIILTMQMSLDGIVSRPEEWMTLSEEILEDHVTYYETVDAVVFGGNTYEGLEQYWTAAEVSSESPMERALAKRLNDLPKFIPTRSEIDLTWRNAKAIRVIDDESFLRELNGLKSRMGRISVESGIRTWHRCLRHQLYDTLWVLVHPVIAAEGDRLFDSVRELRRLKLADSKTYQNGVVGLRYKKA